MATAIRPKVTPTLPAYPAVPSAGYTPGAGGVPAVANPLATAKEAAEGNIALAPDMKALGRRYNEMLRGQYTSGLPGYSDMAATSSGNIQSLLKGEIPADVLYNLGQAAAERGVGAGVSGSPFESSEYLKALGLTSLGLKEKGEQEFTGAMQRLRSMPFFDVSSQLVKPEDMWKAAQQANILAAAPNPAAAQRMAQESLMAGLTAGGGVGGYGGVIPRGGVPNLGSVAGTTTGPGYGPVFGGAGTRPDAGYSSTYNPWSEGGWAGGMGIPSYTGEDQYYTGGEGLEPTFNPATGDFSYGEPFTGPIDVLGGGSSTFDPSAREFSLYD